MIPATHPIFATYETLGFTLASGKMWYDHPSRKIGDKWVKQTDKDKTKIMAFDKKEGEKKASWKDDDKRVYVKGEGRNAYALLTGEKSGCSAIDIDDPTLAHNVELMDLMMPCNMVAKTSKGFHYLFKYTPLLNQTTGRDDEEDTHKLDIRNDGGLLYVEPTIYNKNGTMTKYEWIKKPEDCGDTELVECPEEVIEFLRNLDERFVKAEEKEEEEQEEEMPVENSTTTTTASDPSTETNQLVKVVEALDKKRFASYEDWLKIGMVCYNEHIPLSVWEEQSKIKYERYGKGSKRVCAEKWATFAKEKGRKVMGATLWKWLKSDNPNAFWGLMEHRQDFWNLIALLNHKDIAKHFYNINPDAYLWGETMGWYSLTGENIWKHYEKSQPSGLKRHIADTMQDLAMDTKKAELASYQKRSANETDQDKQKELLKQHASRIVQIHSAYKIFGSSEFCNGVIAFLPSFFEKEDLEECMDMSRYIFAFTDGCFDLNTCKFRKIMPNDWVSTTTGYAYPKKDNPEVREKIKAFLYGLFENHQDDEYLIKVLASCLYGGNRWEEYYGFTGSGGNGKGVIAELMTAVFGDYYLSVDNTLFTKPLERKDQPIPALVEARCKRVMMSTEPESDDRLQAGLIKKISGGDPIEARTLHSKHIVKYKPQFKLILQMNNIPKMSKIDGGIERRMRIIMFPFKFVSADKMCETYHRLGDPDVKEKHCKSPEWRDEFMLMLTEVYKTIKDLKTLPTPSSVSNATSEYIDDNNPLKLWLNKHYNITKDENHKIGASDLKRAYLEDTGVEKIADASFKSLLEFNGVVRKRETTGVVYVGLKRKAPEGMIADA